MRIESVRGSLVESIHRVSAAVVDAGGRLVARSGDPQFSSFLRSAAKPFQAMPLVADGVVERFSMTQEELALACSSHNSEPDQVARVQAFLDRVGCSESDLACGPHRPLWRDLALPSEVKGMAEVPRTRVASNCSGKHTGMLAFARHRGWETRGYHEASHPVQRRCLEEMARWSGMRTNDIGTAVDGCGVLCFAMPLDRMAVAFARLGGSDDKNVRTVTAAMMGHPELVAGRGRLCTALMQAYPGKILVKVGAEGIYGAALIEQGLGVGIKVEDGHAWAACLALLSILQQLGLKPDPVERLAPYAAMPIKNTRGEPVGLVRAAGDLTFI